MVTQAPKNGDAADFSDQWKAARERMADGVEAVLCFDAGFTGAELFGYTSFVLDDVVLPEFEKAVGRELPKSWCVMTLESNSKVVVRSGLTREGAMALIKQLNEEKGVGEHWIQRDF
ncbi:hypothetical protein [Pseudoduganella violaceinigra]|uniref:hypothetical protein n=1 Tax=Pseudoduganella violaceinigra TaxID=246602 RepID=UPI0004853E2C|nr:hypothetical protein [Pseudoduganella violaceinigra]